MLGSATKLETARNITLTGDVTGSASFDGSKNVTIETDIKNSTTQVAIIDTIKYDTNIKFIVKRNMNIVHINIQMLLPQGKDAGVMAINGDELLPEWAKCTGNNEEVLGKDEYIDGVKIGSGTNYSTINSFGKIEMGYYPTASVKHKIAFSYQRVGTSETKIHFVFTYIV